MRLWTSRTAAMVKSVYTKHDKTHQAREHVSICQHTSVDDDYQARTAFDIGVQSTHGQLPWRRTRPTNGNASLEEFTAVRAMVMRDETLPAVSCVLDLDDCHCFLLLERDREVICLPFYQTPGRYPPHSVDLNMNAVNLGWVGGSNDYHVQI